MGKKVDLYDFERDMVAGATQSGLTSLEFTENCPYEKISRKR